MKKIKIKFLLTVLILWLCPRLALAQEPKLLITTEVVNNAPSDIDSKDSKEITSTSQTTNYSNYTAIGNLDLRSIYTFKANHWYKIFVRGEAMGCGEENATRTYMLVKMNDCINCSNTTNVLTADIKWNITNGAASCFGEKLTPIVNGGTPAYTYNWTILPGSPPQGTVTLSNQTPTGDIDMTLKGTGNAACFLKVTDSKGCFATDLKNFLYYTCAPLGIQEEEGSVNMFQIKPNPNNGTFTIFTDMVNEKNVFIYDMTGKVVFEKTKTKEQTFNIDISHLATGIYLVKVGDENNYQMKKVVIE